MTQREKIKQRWNELHRSVACPYCDAPVLTKWGFVREGVKAGLVTGGGFAAIASSGPLGAIPAVGLAELAYEADDVPEKYVNVEQVNADTWRCKQCGETITDEKREQLQNNKDLNAF